VNVGLPKRPLAILSGACSLQELRIQVCSQHRYLPAGRKPQHLFEEDYERIRFLASGTSGAPHANFSAALVFAKDLRQHVFPERAKMMLVAKKERFSNCQIA
jgi:hypothetical protein